MGGERPKSLLPLYICLVLGGEASVTMGTYVHRLDILCAVYVYRFLHQVEWFKNCRTTDLSRPKLSCECQSSWY